jgi:hypothetical protein
MLLVAASRAAVLPAVTPPGKTLEIAALEVEMARLDRSSRTGAVLQFLEATARDSKLETTSRQWAIDLLEEQATGMDEARETLARLAAAPAAGGIANRLRPYAELAFWKAELKTADDPDWASSLLIAAANGDLPFPNWAAHELCRRGVEEAWGVVEPILDYSREELVLCRHQIATLRDCEDAVKGLTQALYRPDPNPYGRLHRWATEILAELGTPESLDRLIEYGLRLQASDWSKGRQIAFLLRSHGFSRERLAELGFDDTPSWIRERERAFRRRP